MKKVNYSIAVSDQFHYPPIAQNKKEKFEQLLSYYESAGPDYASWSKDYNMHFGYYDGIMNPFNREALLANMNSKVFELLGLKESKPNEKIVDLGCGVGASLRQAVTFFPHLDFSGITIVPWQVMKGVELNHQNGLENKIAFIEGDYIDTPFQNNSVNYVFAIESGCYANGQNKSDLLNEIHRILKPGGKFVIADGFTLGNRPMNSWLQSVYRKLCNSWALEELGNINQVKSHLDALEFSHIVVKNISWNVAPSVVHVPFTVINFLFRQFFFGKSEMTTERWDNLKSPLLTMILGLAKNHFGYYLISGTK